VISDTKASKITQKHLFYKAFTVRVLEAASSSPATSTKKAIGHPPYGFFALRGGRKPAFKLQVGLPHRNLSAQLDAETARSDVRRSSAEPCSEVPPLRPTEKGDASHLPFLLVEIDGRGLRSSCR